MSILNWVKGASIGSGGSLGEVWLGMDLETGSLMAVKQVKASSLPVPSERQKLCLDGIRQKCEALKRLPRHDNVLQLLDVVAPEYEEGTLNIFIEYIPGGSVASLLKNYGAFEEKLVADFTRQILQGLKFLHEDMKMAHGGIKTENILVDNKGAVKLSDTQLGLVVQSYRERNGIASKHGDSMTSLNQGREEDVSSVGKVIIEMLTGDKLSPEMTPENAAVLPPEDVSPRLRGFLSFILASTGPPSAAEALSIAWVTGDVTVIRSSPTK